MWYDSSMPAELPEKIIETADAAVVFAQGVRRTHRRRTKPTERRRETDIQIAMDRLREAMIPLRSEIGRFPYGPQTATAESNREAIREASAAIQRERRKLWKMQTKQENDLAV